MLLVDYVDDISKHMKVLLEHIHNANNRYSYFLNILKITEIEKESNEGTKELKDIKKIEYNDVSLSYDSKNIILDKINLKIDKFMQVAIVGKSGAGKTSFVNLIPRFYDICNGSIKINGIDIREYTLESLRNNIAYVFQEPVVFDMSILDNIKFGNSDELTLEDITRTCKKIGLDDKIMKLPDKYNTMINSKTDLLSYGEKQLLSFARAILKNADIIILDEVTSNLDLELEKQIMQASKEMLKNKISFVIAHRLNTIKNSDLIIYIEDKKIVEMGTHNELISKRGYYYNLYESRGNLLDKLEA